MTGFTGLGSWPGTDIAAAAGQVAEAFPDAPFLPELPARGPEAAMVGRALGLIGECAGLGFEPAVTGWATAAHRSRSQRLAWATVRDDLDLTAALLAGWAGPFHVAVTGPWTLAALVARGSGEAVLGDAGATRDLAQAWVEAARQWVARVGAVLPEAAVTLQVDEPLLPAVLGAEIKTVSGLGRHRAPDRETVAAAYAGLPAVADTVVHCCAAGLDVGLMAEAGFTAVSVDTATLDGAAKDRLAAFSDRGGGLWLGVVPTDRPGEPVPGLDALLGPTLRLLEDLSVDPRPGRVTLTPACGLAGFGVTSALRVGQVLARLAAAVDEESGPH